MQVAEMRQKKHNSHVATNIKTLRKAKGWNSAMILAEKADMPFPTIRDIEAGVSQGRPDTIQKIAETLGVTVADLHKDPNAPEQQAEPNDRASLIGTINLKLFTLNDVQLRYVLNLVNQMGSSTTANSVNVSVETPKSNATRAKRSLG